MSRTRKIATPPATALAVMLPDDFVAMLAGEQDQRIKALGWLFAMMELANAGNTKALEQVKAVYKVAPQAFASGNMLQHNAEVAVLNAFLGDKQPYARWMVETQLNEMRADLLGAQPTPLERILVDRVVLCWLQMTYLDTLMTDRLAGSHSSESGDYYARRAERAQRQFLRAVQTLATVRRLLVPVVQLNVGAQQVNVAS